MSKRKFNLSKKELEEMYYIQKRSIKQIEKDLGITDMGYWFKKYDIKIRTSQEQNRLHIPSKQKLENLYIEEKLSTVKIGDLFNVCPSTISNWLGMYDIPMRSRSKALKLSLPSTIFTKGFKPWNKGLSRETDERTNKIGVIQEKHFSEELLNHLYWIDKMSQEEIANKLGISRRIVVREMRLHKIKARINGTVNLPTSYEKKIIEICDKYNFPFKYVGNGEIWIAGKNPDFIQTNGKKLIIETYCDFYKDDNYETERKEIYSEYGYKTLFLSDKDININSWKEICINKIKEFLGEG